MFYKEEAEDHSRAVVVLTPSESKRLIARGVAKMAEVASASKKGRIIIMGGTTNAFVAEEIAGVSVDRFNFAIGRITEGELSALDVDERLAPVILVDGKAQEGMSLSDALKDFTADDVYIKGANAVDMDGNAGVLMSSDFGGTIAKGIGILTARGANLIVPVGLEKLVPSVACAAADLGGQGRIAHATGDRIALMVLTSAKVVTELEAVDILFGGGGVKATHVASGGIGGSEGAVTLVLQGPGSAIKTAFEYISALKGEPNVSLKV